MSARQEFNKLVRDRIKEKIETKGETCAVRELSDEEFVVELRKKLVEEATELAQSTDREDFLSEYADLMVVLDSLANLWELSEAEIKLALRENVERKGLFKNKHFLLWTAGNGE